ncbi:hypothetical protein [Salicibibacter kimchii]|uniref:hypothetical protein n=1 Tax=Salicibibacter kimchii TaxID=2099786 RepID=UPI00135BBD0C|nr:hypothetical protein [Salicibibacter kimchii]
MSNVSFFDKSDGWLMMAWMLAVITTATIYPFLPEGFAIHLNVAGELGNELSKGFGA